MTKTEKTLDLSLRAFLSRFRVAVALCLSLGGWFLFSRTYLFFLFFIPFGASFPKTPEEGFYLYGAVSSFCSLCAVAFIQLSANWEGTHLRKSWTKSLVAVVLIHGLMFLFRKELFCESRAFFIGILCFMFFVLMFTVPLGKKRDDGSSWMSIFVGTMLKRMLQSIGIAALTAGFSASLAVNSGFSECGAVFLSTLFVFPFCFCPLFTLYHVEKDIFGAGGTKRKTHLWHYCVEFLIVPTLFLSYFTEYRNLICALLSPHFLDWGNPSALVLLGIDSIGVYIVTKFLSVKEDSPKLRCLPLFKKFFPGLFLPLAPFAFLKIALHEKLAFCDLGDWNVGVWLVAVSLTALLFFKKVLRSQRFVVGAFFGICSLTCFCFHQVDTWQPRVTERVLTILEEQHLLRKGILIPAKNFEKLSVPTRANIVRCIEWLAGHPDVLIKDLGGILKDNECSGTKDIELKTEDGKNLYVDNTIYKFAYHGLRKFFGIEVGERHPAPWVKVPLRFPFPKEEVVEK